MAIDLRDGDPVTRALMDQIEETPSLSVVTWIELEGGVRGRDADLRRARLDHLLTWMPVLPFGAAEVAAYRGIISVAGFSRRKVLDRMIAAQAIVAGATLVTRNGEDFRDVPGLALLEW